MYCDFYSVADREDAIPKFVKSIIWEIENCSIDVSEWEFDTIFFGGGTPSLLEAKYLDSIFSSLSKKYDISNMKIAEETDSPVILITDIERGGSFASLVGTMKLIEKKYQNLVKGFVFNKFRGDIEILKPGFRKLKKITNKPILGTIPLTKFSIPDEDSIGKSAKKLVWNKTNLRKLDLEIDKISYVVKSSLNISAIKRILK